MKPGFLTDQESTDINAITQLALYYSDSCSRGDVEAAVQTYTMDGVRKNSAGVEFHGREDISKALSSAMGPFDFVFNITQAGVVNVEGDTATARFPVTEWAHRNDGKWVQFLFWWEDRLSRTEEGWRFTRRDQIAGSKYEFDGVIF